MMSKKAKTVGTAVIIGGVGLMGVSLYDQLSEKYNNEAGEQAVERCVDDGTKCNLEEYKAAAEYARHQEKAEANSGLGVALTFLGTAIFTMTPPVRRKVKPSKKPPTPPKS